MFGSFAADLILAGANHREDEVSVSNGFFAWVAVPRLGGPTSSYANLSGGTNTAQFRGRLQINVGNDAWTMF